MRYDDLQMLYRELRRELDAAYGARPWNTARIDRIAEDLLRLERSLAQTRRPKPRELPPRFALPPVAHRPAAARRDAHAGFGRLIDVRPVRSCRP